MKAPLRVIVGVLTHFLIVFVFLSLSYWQYQKSIVVAQREATFQALTQKEALNLELPLLFSSVHEGAWFVMPGTFYFEHAILLDNQIYQGEVGYRWMVPFASPFQKQAILVDLGFVSAHGTRDLPILPKLQQEQEIKGQLYKPFLNPFNAQLLPEDGFPMRIQALNLKELSKHLHLKLSSLVMRLESLQNLTVVPIYKPTRMTSSKHKSYALQWLLFALVWIILMKFYFNHKD